MRCQLKSLPAVIGKCDFDLLLLAGEIEPYVKVFIYIDANARHLIEFPDKLQAQRVLKAEKCNVCRCNVFFAYTPLRVQSVRLIRIAQYLAKAGRSGEFPSAFEREYWSLATKASLTLPGVELESFLPQCG